MISLETTTDNSTLLRIKVSGKLTHQDYMTIIPKIDTIIANAKGTKVNAYIDAIDLDGWEFKALLDDIKLGLKHRKAFNNIAIYSHKKWIEILSKIGSWFISGEVKHFKKSEHALDWIKKTL